MTLLIKQLTIWTWLGATIFLAACSTVPNEAASSFPRHAFAAPSSCPDLSGRFSAAGKLSSSDAPSGQGDKSRPIDLIFPAENLAAWQAIQRAYKRDARGVVVPPVYSTISRERDGSYSVTLYGEEESYGAYKIGFSGRTSFECSAGVLTLIYAPTMALSDFGPNTTTTKDSFSIDVNGDLLYSRSATIERRATVLGLPMGTSTSNMVYIFERLRPIKGPG